MIEPINKNEIYKDKKTVKEFFIIDLNNKKYIH